MKRKIQKLQLSRETVRSLEPGQLEQIAGAATTFCSEDLTSCVGCNTRNTCTSRYC